MRVWHSPDTLLTQRTFYHVIIEKEGDYVLPVKNNHPELLGVIEDLYQEIPDTLPEDTTHPILREPIHISENTSSKTNRI